MRIHKVTHPRLGVASWKAIQEAQRAVSASRGFRVCSWCWQPAVRTRCGRKLCAEMIWRAQSPGHCARVVLRRDRFCKLCRAKRSAEVDHVVPVSLGGTGDAENLRGLCTECHMEETRRLRVEKAAFVARTFLKSAEYSSS